MTSRNVYLGKPSGPPTPTMSVCAEAWFLLLRAYKGSLPFAFMNRQRLLLKGKINIILHVSGHLHHCFQSPKPSCLESQPHLGSF